MRVIKYLICYLLFQSLFWGVSAQTYIQPSLGIGLSKVSNENNGNSLYPEFDKKVNPSYGIGVGVEHFFSDKFSSEVFFRFERLILSTSEAKSHFASDREFNYIGKYVKRQYILGASLKFKLAEKLQLFSGLTYVQHGNTTVHHKHFQEIFGEKVKTETEKEKLDVFVGLSYAMTDRIVCSLLVQKMIWQDASQDYLRLNSVSTISLQVAYRFKVLDKLKKKSKVNCPKL